VLVQSGNTCWIFGSALNMTEWSIPHRIVNGGRLHSCRSYLGSYLSIHQPRWGLGGEKCTTLYYITACSL